METLRRVKWALRKVRLPVHREGLVLDVGAGSCPYPRSDVLLERFTSGDHRCGSGVVADRTTVFADAQRMPFKDKAFDFVIASHILEHIKAPELFLNELMRVGCAGYIETPSIMLERLGPYDVHVLEVMEQGGVLRIHKKRDAGTSDFLARLNLARDDPKWSRFFHGAPDMFHTRYFWRDRIAFDIDNPEEQCNWVEEFDDTTAGEVSESYTGGGWRGWGLRQLRRFYASRRKSVDLASILACPECHGSLQVADQRYVCSACRLGFSGIDRPNFLNPTPC